jgi:uncharacterized protein YecE (DUF72 family)
LDVIFVGTSGWRYSEWRGDFYPRGLPHRLELQYVAERVDSIELNGSFYSLQRPEAYRQWAQAPALFAVKGSRFITHMKKLNDVRVPLANFLASGVLLLGEKLGPFLWQFPENMPLDEARFERFFELLPRDTDAASRLARRHDARLKGRSALKSPARVSLRHAVELRRPCPPALRRALEHHRIALVVADTAGVYPELHARTADFTYVRLHGETELYGGGYAPASLKRWARRIRGWARRRDVYVYFDNDRHGRAPFDAMALRALLG